METKRFILSIAIMMMLVFAWRQGVTYMYAKHPDWEPAAMQANNPATQPAAATHPTVAMAPTSAPTTAPVASAGAAWLDAAGAPAPSSSQLGSVVHVDPNYSLGLDVSSTGAGLASVTLNEFYDTAEQKSLYVFQQPIAGIETSTEPLVTRSVTINGISIDTYQLNWTRTASTPSRVTYQTIIKEGGKPELEVDKTFEVFPKKGTDATGGYEVRVSQGFKNLSAKALNVKSTLNGTAAPARENDRSEDRQFIAGFDKGYQEIDVGHTFMGEFSASTPTKDIAKLETSPLLWVGAASSYFNAIIRPLAPTGAIQIAAAPAYSLNSDAPSDQRMAQLTIETNEFPVAAGATASLDMRVFFGPKKRELLGNSYYAAFPLGYDKTLIYTSGFCGFMTFSWLITTLYYILYVFHKIFQDWGIAIICLVCLVRTLLHPITKKSQVNMMQMGKMGPELERIKKKHGDNKDELNKAMMQFYKNQGITPILGCLPMLLQTPIWIAL